MLGNLSIPGTIRTFSGRYVDLLHPTTDMVCIEDIAHALSNECRFSGHTSRFYSVAEHSILCAVFVEDKEDQFCALMHDATEAYLKDLPKPLKMLPEFEFYNELESRWWKVIAEKFYLPAEIPESVKRVDKRLLVTEQRDLMLRVPDPLNDGVEPLPMRLPGVFGGSKDAFLQQFMMLAPQEAFHGQ